MTSAGEKTLQETARGENLDKLVTEVYTELKRLAAYHLKNERPGHTLRPTELVHEVYMVLQTQHSLDFHDRLGFISIASMMMRRVLVDYARNRNRQKRGAGAENIPLEIADEKTLIEVENDRIDVIALEESLTELEKFYPREVKIIELHFFGGLTFEEIARVLNISLRTVMRDARFARSWLCRNLTRED